MTDVESSNIKTDTITNFFKRVIVESKLWVYLLWIFLHYLSAHLYVHYCNENTQYNFWSGYNIDGNNYKRLNVNKE